MLDDESNRIATEQRRASRSARRRRLMVRIDMLQPLPERGPAVMRRLRGLCTAFDWNRRGRLRLVNTETRWVGTIFEGRRAWKHRDWNAD